MYAVQVTSGRSAVLGRGGLTSLTGHGVLLRSAEVSRPDAVSVSKTSSHTLPAAAAAPRAFIL